MFLFKNYQSSDCEVKNLLIILGKKILNNYPLIILEYNQHLSLELKALLTKVINNLQICSQLESRVTKLQSELNAILYEQQSSDRIRYYKQSLDCKNQKLEQLHIDNSHLLIRIAYEFFEKRLLNDFEEFYNIYSRLEELLQDGSCLRFNSYSYLDRIISR